MKRRPDGTLSVHIKSMRQSVEELLRYRSSLSSERHALKRRIEEYLLLFCRDNDAPESREPGSCPHLPE